VRYNTDLESQLLKIGFRSPGDWEWSYSTAPGKFLMLVKDFDTQDIEFNNKPALDLADVKITKEIIDLRTKYGGDPKVLYKRLEARNILIFQKQKTNFWTPIFEEWYIRSGDYVIKYSLVPSSETPQTLYEETIKPDSHPDHILSD
jgi:hypothetical protein